MIMLLQLGSETTSIEENEKQHQQQKWNNNKLTELLKAAYFYAPASDNARGI